MFSTLFIWFTHLNSFKETWLLVDFLLAKWDLFVADRSMLLINALNYFLLCCLINGRFIWALLLLYTLALSHFFDFYCWLMIFFNFAQKFEYYVDLLDRWIFWIFTAAKRVCYFPTQCKCKWLQMYSLLSNGVLNAFVCSFVFYHPGVNFYVCCCFEMCVMLFVRACSLVFVFFTSEFNGSLLQLIEKLC